MIIIVKQHINKLTKLKIENFKSLKKLIIKKILIKIILFSIYNIFLIIKSNIKKLTIFFNFKNFKKILSMNNRLNYNLNFSLKKNINIFILFLKKIIFEIYNQVKLKFMIRGISYKFKFYKKNLNIYLLLRLGLNYKIFFFKY